MVIINGEHCSWHWVLSPLNKLLWRMKKKIGCNTYKEKCILLNPTLYNKLVRVLVFLLFLKMNLSGSPWVDALSFLYPSLSLYNVLIMSHRCGRSNFLSCPAVKVFFKNIISALLTCDLSAYGILKKLTSVKWNFLTSGQFWGWWRFEDSFSLIIFQ